MKLCGIDFVPFNIPLKNRLETLAAGMWFALFLGLFPLGISTTIYLLFFSKLWPLVCVYLFWIWVIDKDISEIGGRSSEWVRSWTLFKYVVNYFPVTIKTVPGFQMDPTKNYLFGTFPHGFLPIGVVSAINTYGSKEAREIFRHHTVYGSTLRGFFFIPMVREYLLAIGTCSTTCDSLDFLLSCPAGGNAVGLVVGGASESFFCNRDEYRLVVKNRKGFVKLALRNGSPIVPIFSFGQNNIFELKVFSEGSIVQNFQKFLKKLTGVAFQVVNGRGLFQYTFGCIPLQRPINIVVGAPIEIAKIINPSQEEIDSIHQVFIKKLSELFEQYKYEYEANPGKCSIVIS